MSKSDQTWYGISHVYLEYKTENNFCCSLSRKKDSISIGNINSFSYSILKIIEILSDEGVFKVNQIDIPDYLYYLGCNAKRAVRLTFLKKVRFSIGNIDSISYSILKIIEILSDQGVRQSEPN